MHEGLNVTILNPSIILGCGDWEKTSLKLLPKLNKGTPFYPLGSTGFVDVKDVATIAVKSISDTSKSIDAFDFHYTDFMITLDNMVNNYMRIKPMSYEG